jgi:hypothetical protein
VIGPEEENAMNTQINGIIRVGDGRGFIVQGGGEHRYVITAAHCLPFFPPCHGFSYLEERTYKALLGTLGAEPSVWAECLFADPIADIAVLGEPDSQVLWDEAAAYTALVEAVDPLSIAEPAWQEGDIKIIPAIPGMELPERRFVSFYEAPAWLFSLDGRGCRCQVSYRGSGQCLSIDKATDGIRGGMSGSPIVIDNGAAVGVVCLGGGGPGEAHTAGGPNPRLTQNLPGWLLHELGGS